MWSIAKFQNRSNVLVSGHSQERGSPSSLRNLLYLHRHHHFNRKKGDCLTSLLDFPMLAAKSGTFSTRHRTRSASLHATYPISSSYLQSPNLVAENPRLLTAWSLCPQSFSRILQHRRVSCMNSLNSSIRFTNQERWPEGSKQDGWEAKPTISTNHILEFVLDSSTLPPSCIKNGTCDSWQVYLVV